MPSIKVEGPELDLEGKRALVREITSAVATAWPHVPVEGIVVTIVEHSPENVSLGGVLVADRKQ